MNLLQSHTPVYRLVGRALEDVRTGRFERSLSALTAVGAAVTTAEVFMSHDGASFGNKMMWWPVVIMPTAVPAGIAAVFSARAARTVLPLTSAVIVANVSFSSVIRLRWRAWLARPLDTVCPGSGPST